MKELTKRQEEVLGFIREHLKEAGYPPTLRELCASLGIKGPKNAAKHLDALEKKGRIRRNGCARGIELLDGWVRQGVSIPIAGRVNAGPPSLAVEDVLGHIVLDESFFGCRDAFLLKVEGESMTGAGISDGDFVVVRPQDTASEGEIVVALVDGEATVKRFSRSGGAIVLKPENPSMGPIVVGSASAVMIIGRVISVIRRL